MKMNKSNGNDDMTSDTASSYSLNDEGEEKEKEKAEALLPYKDRFLGYLSFSVPYLSITALTFGLPLGLLFFPKSIGLFVTLPYWSYTLTIGRHEIRDGCRRISFSQNFFVFRAMRRLLRLEIAQPLPKELIEAEQKPNAQFLIAMFPHGVWADYHVSLDGLWHTVFPNIYPKMRSLTASVLFRVPIIREWALWTGSIDASKEVAEAALQRGRTIIVKPGGLAEQLRTTKGREILYLSKRKGFLKMALKYNIPVVPCYVFGASDYHFTWDGLFLLREWVQKRFRLCLPIAVGYWGSFCPLPVKTTVVLGKPLLFQPLQKKENPAESEVDAAHKQFCEALHDLFDEHKVPLGYGNRQLELA